jgi:short-subunit dehydrogenase
MCDRSERARVNDQTNDQVNDQASNHAANRADNHNACSFMNTARTVLITGASRGIGAAIAEQLVQRGDTVFGLARWQRAEDSAVAGVHRVHVDLSDLELTSRVVRKLCQEQPIDAVVLNAGTGDIAPLENISATLIGPSLLLNLGSPLVVARECVSHLRSRNRSDLIFIGSESALQGGRQGSLYSAAKFGLRGAAQALRHELAGANVHVGIVQPGLTRSDFFDTLDFEPGPNEANALHTTDIAHAVLAMLNSDDRAIIDEIVIKPRQNVVSRKN